MPSQASSGNIVMVVRGASQGAIAQSVLQAAAKNFSAAEGFEANISIQTGATVGDKIQLDVANNPDDAVQGARYDIMAGLSGGLGAVLTRTGFGIGDWAGQFPIATDGWIMRAFAQFGATVGGGIDFTNIEIDGPLIQGTSNTTTLPSINAVPGISLSGNHSGGSGEINLFNTFAAAGTTFIVQQMTGAGTKVDVLQVDPSPAAGNTAMVLLLNNGGLSSQRISFGIADSAGAGFRLLRIPN